MRSWSLLHSPAPAAAQEAREVLWPAGLGFQHCSCKHASCLHSTLLRLRIGTDPVLQRHTSLRELPGQARRNTRVKMLCHTGVTSHEFMAQLVFPAQSWPQPLNLAACCYCPRRPQLASGSLWLLPEGEPKFLAEFLCSSINIANCHDHFPRGTKETS